MNTVNLKNQSTLDIGDLEESVVPGAAEMDVLEPSTGLIIACVILALC